MREATLSEVKQIMIEVLTDFHKFCEENGLEYFAGYGTLIGAVRHKGFIPWDDDLDIVMPRRDYMRMIELFNKRSSQYRLACIDTDERYPYGFAKVYDSRTKLVEHLYREYTMGVYIDIFPLDNWPVQEGILSKIKRLQILTKIKTYKIGRYQGAKKNLFLMLLKPLFTGISSKKFIQKIATMVEDAEKEAGFIGSVCGNVYGIKERMPKAWFEGGNIVPFENAEIRIPMHYDKILAQLYGDYMQLPPEEKRISHHDNDVYI